MVKELQRLLHETADTPPADGVDLRRVLSSGRRRLRRRRAGALGGAAGVAAVVVAGSLTVSGIGPLAGLTGDGAFVSGSREPVGPVSTLADARAAKPGVDYRVLSTLVNENLDRANGVLYVGSTPDGRIVLQDGPHGLKNRVRWGLLDPTTEKVRWLPDPTEASADHFVGTDDRWLVFVSEQMAGGAQFVAFDRDADRWTEIRINSSRIGSPNEAFLPLSKAVVGPDGRLFFAMPTGGEGEQSELWSASIESGEARPENVLVGDFDITVRKLVYTEYTNRPNRNVHVRDLETGTEEVFDSEAGSSCNSLGLAAVDDVIALPQYCGTDDGTRDDRIQVLSTAGDPVVTLRGNGMDLGALTDRFVAAYAYVGKQAGAYAYDLTDGELLHLTSGSVKFSPSMTGTGDLLTWATPVNGRHGMKLWTATFDE